MRIRIPSNGWVPRPYQRKLWEYLENGGKRACAVFHRRAGKDEVALHRTCVAAHERLGTYWHMLPEASQARKAIWNAINPHTGKRRIDEAFPLDLRENTNDQEMFIRFRNQSTWQVLGSDNYNSLVGSPPLGVVYSEYALANPLARAYLRPILAENGGWELYIYTPRGRNHGADLYEMAENNPDWFCQKLTAEETGVFTKEQLETELREYISEYGEQAGKAIFRQEYYCSFDAAILGAVYGEWVENCENSGRVTECYDPGLPVYTTHDLGYGDAHAVWFYQLAHNEVRFIDYWEDTGKDTKGVCEALFGRRIIIKDLNPDTSQVNNWSFGPVIPEFTHRTAYQYDKHYFPHDAAYKLQTARGRSFAQQAYEFGVKGYIITSTNQETAIQATRKLFPTFWFSPRCKEGLNALRNYQFVYDQNTRTFRKEPKHDWSSHGAKALELVGRSNIAVVKEEKSKEKPRFLHEITSNELFFPENQGIRHRERI